MSDVGKTLGGRYQLGDVVGHGGMAEVHAGTDIRLGRQVAIKVLRPDLARDPAFLQRFRREAQSAAGLNHPNIVAVYDTGEDRLESGVGEVTVPWIVMERVEGVTLRQILSSGRKITPERALDIIDGVLAALDYSHRHGIVHRDIKPANIMITNNGQVKVMDFGIARALADSSATMTHTNAVMGTAQYLSPEQARGEVVDARSDIYSTGCLLYELLTGQAPFVGDSPMAIAFQHVSAEPIAPSSVNPSVPMRFDTLVLKSLAKSPENRYTTAADMRADVNRLLAGEAATAQLAAAKLDETQRIQPITTKNSSMARSNKPKKAALISAAIAVTAVVIGALVLVSRLISPGEVAQVNVPDLAGLTLDRAAVVLSNAGLTIGETTYQNSDDRPANTIISQNPIPDALVDKGTAVSVIVSKGKDQVPVPTLVNLASQDEARLALEAVGLFLGEVTIEDNEAPLGTVLRSDPPAGTYVVAESRVSIVVSSGKITVPNVIGLTEADARDELFNLGFLVNVVYSEIDTIAPGLVLDQSPKADKLLAVGRTITLTVSQLPVDPSETIADPNATP